CINSCAAFVGPWANLDACPTCGEPRYDQKWLEWSHGRSARSMRYGNERTQQIFDEIHRNDGFIDAYDDILTGSAYLDAVRVGRIKPGDMVLMISIDGAQLYESKMSDCWMYIWIIVDHSPERLRHYKKKHVLPEGVIPGLN
ncbi:hypothetical protein C8R48DRAFT_551450, partial [Suillus tomentosus]